MQVRRRVEYFASRGCVAIDGLGPVTIDALVASGRVKSAADLYRLTRDDLKVVPRLGDETAAQLLAFTPYGTRAQLDGTGWASLDRSYLRAAPPANAPHALSAFPLLDIEPYRY